MQPVKEFTRKHYGQLVFDIEAAADDMMQEQRCKAMPERGMYEQQTRQIRVVVKPFYLEDQSSPDENHFVWAYHVKIENIGRETVQLRNRYWRITDAFGRVQEVRGPGVVGEQPILHPGEHFEYTSGTPLQTPSGIMVGTYQMESATGECFDVAIPAFSLDSPHQPIQLN